MYIKQDLRKGGNYDQLWFFKEVNLTTNDTSLHVNSTISTPMSKEMLKFLEAGS